MQQKLCLWTCVVVLVGALCAGNPFLCGRDGAAPLSASPVRDAAPDVDRGEVDRGEPAAAPRSRRDVPDAIDGAADETLGRAHPLDAIVPVALATRLPADPASTCPDPAVAPLVERSYRDARGETVWVLRDGSRLVRNPRRGEGQPLLVAQ